mmetsp:Transcript_19871/g.39397  ORF Transcript_19871/g.39397 Transcript_19871/m.39397 type:complete len:236 (-) Transcript_19871:933-1640(-)
MQVVQRTQTLEVGVHVQASKLVQDFVSQDVALLSPVRSGVKGLLVRHSEFGRVDVNNGEVDDGDGVLSLALLGSRRAGQRRSFPSHFRFWCRQRCLCAAALAADAADVVVVVAVALHLCFCFRVCLCLCVFLGGSDCVVAPQNVLPPARPRVVVYPGLPKRLKLTRQSFPTKPNVVNDLWNRLLEIGGGVSGKAFSSSRRRRRRRRHKLKEELLHFMRTLPRLCRQLAPFTLKRR